MDHLPQAVEGLTQSVNTGRSVPARGSSATEALLKNSLARSRRIPGALVPGRSRSGATQPPPMLTALQRLYTGAKTGRTPRTERPPAARAPRVNQSPRPASFSGLTLPAPPPASVEAEPYDPLAGSELTSSPEVPSNPKDRRAHPRRESGCEVSVCPCAAHEGMTPQQIEWALHSTELKGRLVDVSMSGLALELSDPVEAQSRVFLRISNRNLDRRIDTSARILRCTSGGAGHWNIVCRLEKNLSFEQLHYLGRHLFASTIV